MCNVTDEKIARTTSPVEEQIDLPEGIPLLSSLYLYIAGSCNLACRHCWITPIYQPGGNDGPFIKLEHVEKAIREAKPLGLRSVKLTGGEPTLHPRLREIVSLVSEAGLDIIVETNGTLIDTDLADFLKQRRVCFISVSLDGATAETHEALRLVEGSFKKALEGIRALIKIGFRPQIICTLHRGNLGEAEAIIYLAQELGCRSVKFNIVQPIGRGERFGSQEGLDITEVLQFGNELENNILPKCRIPVYLDVPLAFQPIRRLLRDPQSRCTVLNILGVLSSGELSLCGIGFTVPDLIYGHIETDKITNVWSNSPGLLLLRELVPAGLQGVCGQCLHRDICLGSCVANNYNSNLKLNAPFYFCELADKIGIYPISRKNLI